MNQELTDNSSTNHSNINVPVEPISETEVHKEETATVAKSIKCDE